MKAVETNKSDNLVFRYTQEILGALVLHFGSTTEDVVIKALCSIVKSFEETLAANKSCFSTRTRDLVRPISQIIPSTKLLDKSLENCSMLERDTNLDAFVRTIIHFGVSRSETLKAHLEEDFEVKAALFRLMLLMYPSNSRLQQDYKLLTSPSQPSLLTKLLVDVTSLDESEKKLLGDFAVLLVRRRNGSKFDMMESFLNRDGWFLDVFCYGVELHSQVEDCKSLKFVESLKARGEIDAALRHCCKLLEGDGNNVRVLLEYSCLLVVKGEINDAKKILMRAHEMESANVDVLCELGMFHLSVQYNLSEALKWIEKALDPKEDIEQVLNLRVTKARNDISSQACIFACPVSISAVEEESVQPQSHSFRYSHSLSAELVWWTFHDRLSFLSQLFLVATLDALRRRRFSL